jgi:hypothetical protein
MAISKALSLPRPLNLPKPAPSAQASTPKPAKPASGGVAGQAAAPRNEIKPNAKPQGERNGPSVDSFNPNAKPKPQGVPTVGINPNTPTGGIIPIGDKANPQRTEKPDGRPTVGINPNTPNGGVIIPGGGWANPQRTEKPSGPFFETGGWANHGLGKPEVTDPAIGGRNPHATGDINTHGTKPTPPEPWTTYGEALEQNRDVFPNKDVYDLGAAIDKAFGTSGGAELLPGGGWGDLLEANGAVPPGSFDVK